MEAVEWEVIELVNELQNHLNYYDNSSETGEQMILRIADEIREIRGRNYSN